MKKILLLSAACVFLGGIAQETHASGYGMKLTSGKLIARSNAGSAVEKDVLASFTNPANLMQLLGYEAAVMGTAVIPHVKFYGTTTSPAAPYTAIMNADSGRQVGKNAIVPAMGFGGRIHDRVAVGVWMGAPFGLKMNYGNHFGGNRYVIKAGLTTMNITPSIAVKLHDMVQVGAGFQAMKTKVKLTSQASSSASNTVQALLTRAQTKQEVKGDDWSYGWTAGILLQPLKCFKLGFSYRSEMKAHLKGHLRFTNPTISPVINASLANTKAKADLKHPDIYTLSAAFDVTNRLTLFGDVIRTNWSSIKTIVIKTPDNPMKSIIVQKWKDVWFYSGGFDFQANDCWKIHGGVGFDQSPTKNKYRVPGIPDSDKWWYSIGTTVDITKKISMTLGYGFEHFKKGKVNLRQADYGNGPNPTGSRKGDLNGHIKSRLHLATVQFNVKL